MYSSSSCAFDELTWSPLSSRRKFNRAVFTYKCINGMINYDLKLRPNKTVHNCNTRRENDMHLPTVKTEWGKQFFSYQAIKEWNYIDLSIRKFRNTYTLSLETPICDCFY